MTSTNGAERNEQRCLRCGRKITAAASRAAGMGRTCQARVRDALATAVRPGVKAEQVAKAVELIAQGGVVPPSRPAVFRTVGSAGDVIYLTHAATCTCPAGLRARRCYHSVAVELMTTAATIQRAA